MTKATKFLGVFLITCVGVVLLFLLMDRTNIEKPVETVENDPSSASTATEITVLEPELTAAELISTIDVLRVEKDGSSLIAGKAQPGTSVQIMIDGVAVDEVETDGAGNFVSLFEIEPSVDAQSIEVLNKNTQEIAVTERFLVQVSPEAPQENLAAVDDAEGLTSKEPAENQAVAIENAQVEVPTPTAPVPEQPNQQIAQAISSDTVDQAGAPDKTSDKTSNKTPEQSPEPSTAQTQIEASVPQNEASLLEAAKETNTDSAETEGAVVISVPETGIATLKQAPRTGAQNQSPLAVNAMSYGANGEVIISGTAPVEKTVRVYLDNQFMGEDISNQQGGWQVELPFVDSGDYGLRVDVLDELGDVSARIRSPFRREAAEVLERLTQQGDQEVTVTVLPGFTLWGIARQQYGAGLDYVKVFEANRGQIDDPDLIYPGQIFTLPTFP